MYLFAYLSIRRKKYILFKRPTVQIRKSSLYLWLLIKFSTLEKNCKREGVRVTLSSRLPRSGVCYVPEDLEYKEMSENSYFNCLSSFLCRNYVSFLKSAYYLGFRVNILVILIMSKIMISYKPS